MDDYVSLSGLRKNIFQRESPPFSMSYGKQGKRGILIFRLNDEMMQALGYQIGEKVDIEINTQERLGRLRLLDEGNVLHGTTPARRKSGGSKASRVAFTWREGLPRPAQKIDLDQIEVIREKNGSKSLLFMLPDEVFKPAEVKRVNLRQRFRHAGKNPKQEAFSFV